MNRLERIQLYERVEKAEAKVAELISRVEALEQKRGPGRPPKQTTDGNGEELRQPS